MKFGVILFFLQQVELTVAVLKFGFEQSILLKVKIEPIFLLQFKQLFMPEQRIAEFLKFEEEVEFILTIQAEVELPVTSEFMLILV